MIDIDMALAGTRGRMAKDCSKSCKPQAIKNKETPLLVQHVAVTMPTAPSFHIIPCSHFPPLTHLHGSRKLVLGNMEWFDSAVDLSLCRNDAHRVRQTFLQASFGVLFRVGPYCFAMMATPQPSEHYFGQSLCCLS